MKTLLKFGGLILGLTATFLHAEPTKGSEWSPTPQEGWKPVELGDFMVKPGSALDFSYLVEAGPAGQHGFLKINRKGEFAFEGQPDKPVRFFSCSNPMEYWGPETPEEIAAYAEQVRLAGYNCFRAHFLDLMLMIDTTNDLEPNPKQLERWDILAAELKKRGIYLYVDLTTTWCAFYANKVRGNAYTPERRAFNLYGRMYGKDAAARDHWAKAVRLLLERVNPHTGLALKDDPQVIVFGLRNEADIYFLLKHSNKGGVQEKILIEPFRDWLEQRYGTIAALNAAWPGSNYASFSEIPFPARQGVTPPSQDLHRFIVDREIYLWEWMNGVVAGIGVRSILQDFNVGVEFGENLVRSMLPAVETHSYHDHPSTYVSPGSRMENDSAASRGFPFVTWINEVRQLDRPLIVTEWGYPYWNEWRYEAGLSAPAYGALQGWQFLNHHSEPVKIRPEVTPRPFKIDSDPPNRIGERIATFLYARGDVAPSTHTVAIDLDPEGSFQRLGGEGYMPTALRRLTLLVRTGIRVVDFPKTLPGAPVQAEASLRIHPTEPALVWADDPNSAKTPTEDELVATLRAKNLLPAGNKTNIAGGIYQSDTGELTLDRERKIMIVNTPRSQGVTLPSGSDAITLRDVSFLNQGPSGCFFVGALDSKALSESRRMLILAVGDAINSGAVFEDKNRKVLRALGTYPILVKPMKAQIVLKRTLAEGEKVRLRALAFNGDPLHELPVTVAPEELRLALDAGKMENPVFQYELRIESRNESPSLR